MKVEVEVLVGVGSASRLLAVSRLTVHHYLKASRFPGAFQLPSGMWRIPMSDIDAIRQAGAMKGASNG